MLSIRLMAPKSFPFLAGEHVTFQVGKRSWAAGKGRVFPKEATIETACSGGFIRTINGF